MYEPISLFIFVSPPSSVYKSLDVKNILLETISHHILPQMLASPLWADSNDLLREYLKFMDDHFRESADLTFLAYRHRNYSKNLG
ncbi:N-alpha-acetyltransferase 25, NatB auxiliary subunit [Orobanche gracilis]